MADSSICKEKVLFDSDATWWARYRRYSGWTAIHSHQRSRSETPNLPVATASLFPTLFWCRLEAGGGGSASGRSLKPPNTSGLPFVLRIAGEMVVGSFGDIAEPVEDFVRAWRLMPASLSRTHRSFLEAAGFAAAGVAIHEAPSTTKQALKRRL